MLFLEEQKSNLVASRFAVVGFAAAGVNLWISYVNCCT